MESVRRLCNLEISEDAAASEVLVKEIIQAFVRLQGQSGKPASAAEEDVFFPPSRPLRLCRQKCPDANACREQMVNTSLS